MHFFSPSNSFWQSYCLRLAFEETHCAYVEACAESKGMHNKISQSRSHTIHHWNRPTSLEHFCSSSRLELSFSLAEVSGSSSCLAYAHLLTVDPRPCRRPAREPSMLLDIVFSVHSLNRLYACAGCLRFLPGKIKLK